MGMVSETKDKVKGNLNYLRWQSVLNHKRETPSASSKFPLVIALIRMLNQQAVIPIFFHIKVECTNISFYNTLLSITFN